MNNINNESKKSVERAQDSIEALEALLGISKAPSYNYAMNSSAPVGMDKTSLLGQAAAVLGAGGGIANLANSSALIQANMIMNSFLSKNNGANDSSAVNVPLAFPNLPPQQQSIPNVDLGSLTKLFGSPSSSNVQLSRPSFNGNVGNSAIHQALQTGAFQTLTTAPSQTSLSTMSTIQSPIPPSSHTASVNGVQSFSPIAPAAGTGIVQEKKEIIRSSEIAAALKSKPQRGRKRENLSGLERQELTRTRNREHAKTTRIRKKARYAELEKVETKYQELLDKKEFDSGRKVNVQKFMAIRSNLLKTMIGGSQNDSSWNFSFDGETLSCKSQDDLTSPTTLEPPLALAYKNVLLDCSSFSIDIISGGSLISALNLSNFHANDMEIVGQISSKVEDDSNIVFKFEIKGGEDSIALNDDDIAFAECELTIALDENGNEIRKISIKNDIVQFKFAKDSNKIVSMKILNVLDSCASFSMKHFSNDRLCHKDYPSVVSLNSEIMKNEQ